MGEHSILTVIIIDIWKTNQHPVVFSFISVRMVAILRAWLVFLAVFELPQIFRFLLLTAPMDGALSNLHSGDAERRLWALVLTVLVLARVAAAADLHNATVATHCAGVHLAEALYFLSEFI